MVLLTLRVVLKANVRPCDFHQGLSVVDASRVDHRRSDVQAVDRDTRVASVVVEVAAEPVAARVVVGELGIGS